MNSYSDFLFARGGYLVGFGRLVDLGGVFAAYNISRTGTAADAKALYADWRAVGNDILQGIQRAAREIDRVQPSLFPQDEP